MVTRRMRVSMVLFGAGLLLGVYQAGAQVTDAGKSAAASTVAADATAHQAHEAYVAAINSNNLDSLLSMLTEDVVYLSAHEPVMVGKATVRPWLEAYFKAFKTHWDKPVQEFVVSGDWAFERYSYKSTDTPLAGGAVVEDTGWGLVNYHHDADGKWRVARDAWGPDHPLPRGEKLNPEQSTEITTEYLMTFAGFADPSIQIDNETHITNGRPGGWVKGPKISGKFVSPGADWLRVMPSGALRLDARSLIQTDDNAFIFISYNGIAQFSNESAERLNKGELLTTKDISYVITAPTFQTSSEKYAWLNNIQAVAKCVELQLGEDGGYVKYDVFIVR